MRAEPVSSVRTAGTVNSDLSPESLHSDFTLKGLSVGPLAF